MLLEGPVEGASELIQIGGYGRCIAQVIELGAHVRLFNREAPGLLPGQLIDRINDSHAVVSGLIAPQYRLINRVEDDLLVKLGRALHKVRPGVHVTDHALCHRALAYLREESYSGWFVF